MHYLSLSHKYAGDWAMLREIFDVAHYGTSKDEFVKI